MESINRLLCYFLWVFKMRKNTLGFEVLQLFEGGLKFNIPTYQNKVIATF